MWAWICNIDKTDVAGISDVYTNLTDVKLVAASPIFVPLSAPGKQDTEPERWASLNAEIFPALWILNLP